MWPRNFRWLIFVLKWKMIASYETLVNNTYENQHKYIMYIGRKVPPRNFIQWPTLFWIPKSNKGPSFSSASLFRDLVSRSWKTKVLFLSFVDPLYRWSSEMHNVHSQLMMTCINCHILMITCISYFRLMIYINCDRVMIIINWRRDRYPSCSSWPSWGSGLPWCIPRDTRVFHSQHPRIRSLQNERDFKIRSLILLC